MKTAFFVLFVCSFVFGQTLNSIFVIDDFTFGASQTTQDCGVTLTSTITTQNPPIINTESLTTTSCTNQIISCARDLRTTVNSGLLGRDFNHRILSGGSWVPGFWEIQVPKFSLCKFEIQYDGGDNVFNDILGTPGLNSFDVTQGGSATHVGLEVQIDENENFMVSMYDNAGGICEYDIPVTINFSFTRYAVALSQPTNGNCDLTNINSIKVEIEISSVSVDGMVTKFELYQQVCDPSCQTCSGPLSTDCLSCVSPLLLNDGACTQRCDNGEYSDGTTCIDCPNGCTACTATECTSCASPFLMNDGACTLTCDDGEFSDGTTCIDCLSICATCVEAYHCTSCNSPYFLSGADCVESCNPPLLLNDGVCTQSCDSDEYSDGTTCIDCPNGCATCTSAINCTSCVPPLYLHDGACQAKQ